jgi:O-antigen/teichoic acid export membrane protein
MINVLASLQRRIQQRIPRAGFFRNVAILAGGTAIAQALNVLTAPIITRLYTPNDLGNLSVYISIYSILVVVASWRYETAIPLPKDDETAPTF